MKLLLVAIAMLQAFSIFGAEGLRLKYSRIGQKGEVTVKGESVEGSKLDGGGTAFAFAPRRLLTAAHNVLTDGKKIEPVWIEYAGEWIRAKVTTVSVEADIAVLEISQDIPFSDFGDDPAEDQGIRVSASAKGQKVKDEAAVVKRAYASGLRFLASITYFEHCMSGAPCLVNKKIVGMCVAFPGNDEGDHKQMYFVPVSALKYFAER